MKKEFSFYSVILLCFSIIFPVTASSADITFSNEVPVDVKSASKADLATFAWQEFVALNLPAKVNPSPTKGMSKYFRGQASELADLGKSHGTDTLVWQTFAHRVELYPTNPPAQLPDINAIPSYSYGLQIAKGGTTDLTLFNNLDEASEISLARMYYKPFALEAQNLIKKYKKPSPQQKQAIDDAATKASLLYEAKANPIIYNYIKDNGFINPVTRNAAGAQTQLKINNKPVTGTTFELPSGSIEIKATWRRYDSKVDNLDNYISQEAIYYTGTAPNNLTAHNATMLLVGLHIIHKTPTFPTFTFATFEHVDNEKNGFLFTNADPKTTSVPGIKRKLPDPGIIEAKRQFPIPDYVASLNTSVQNQLRAQYGQKIFLANYQLIGIQAEVVNNPIINAEIIGSAVVPEQEFFLSNFATETNDTLQFFQGSLGGTKGNIPNPNVKKVSVFDANTKKYTAYSAGGCQGCHGAVGQQPGFDFSVISSVDTNAIGTPVNDFVPQPILNYPGGTITPQNPKGFPLPQTIH